MCICSSFIQFSHMYMQQQTLDLTVESHLNAERNTVYNYMSYFIEQKNLRTAKGEATTVHGLGGSLIKFG